MCAVIINQQMYEVPSKWMYFAIYHLRNQKRRNKKQDMIKSDSSSVRPQCGQERKQVAKLFHRAFPRILCTWILTQFRVLVWVPSICANTHCARGACKHRGYKDEQGRHKFCHQSLHSSEPASQMLDLEGVTAGSSQERAVTVHQGWRTKHTSSSRTSEHVI